MRWSDFIDQVRQSGMYDTRDEAERVTRAVLAAVGGQLAEPERRRLATALPTEAGPLLSERPATRPAATRPATAAEFVADVAARTEGATAATARWDVGSVLTVLATSAPDDLVTRLVDALPEGFALLFGRAQLTTAA
ncbi:DUF2267 domain-containing protein [Streptomyces sp. B6B3]|uniref:DUF2267 domain-containing protein n=1 Tax=Streptomyces sp. B6B3 TaxID=3153570 RepID=UPI00325F0EFA